MKTQLIHAQSSALCLCLWLGCLLPHGLQAQGTAFTYQGRLTDGGNPANGPYDLQFILYDANAGGSQVANIITNKNVAVTGGLFTTQIDFGANVFTGASYWLELAVRPGTSTGSFTPLVPRQSLTPAPYALYAAQAATAATAATAASVPWTNLVGEPSGYGAGAGLTLSPSIFNPQFKVFEVNFGTEGAELTAARSDHRHYGVNWNGSAAAGLDIHTSSTSPGAAGLIGQVTGATPGDLSAGVRGISEGTGSKGIGVYGSQNGSGWGVYGTSRSGSGVYGLATESTGNGVVGEANGNSAYGVSGMSTSGTGVHGSSSTGRAVDGAAFNGGVGVYGNNLGSNTKGYAGDFFGRVRVTGDLVLNSGAIKVTGAGVGTSTPAFIHVATASNTAFSNTIIDHPLCNGDPNAILIVTPNASPGGTLASGDARAIGVLYSTSGKWMIRNHSNEDMSLGRAFNVLVVKP